VPVVASMTIAAALPDQGLLLAEQRLVARQSGWKSARRTTSLFQQGVALFVEVDQRIEGVCVARCGKALQGPRPDRQAE